MNTKLLKNASLIFEFIDLTKESNVKLNEINIGEFKISINLEKKKLYEIQFKDSCKLEYKIYKCSFIFKNIKKDFGISIYFDRVNYYYCIGKEINVNSIEIIFNDFSKEKKYLNNCSIIYNKQSYYVKEELKCIKTRKRISFINIDIKKLELPKIKKNKKEELIAPTASYLLSNYLISIEKGEKDRIIGVYKNQPFSCEVDKKEIIALLEKLVIPTKKYLNYNENYNSINEYLENIDLKSDIYRNLLVDSLTFVESVQIKKYFSQYLTSFDKEDILIYKLCCEFLILFPYIPIKNMIKNLIPIKIFIKQIYFSKKVISNFIKQIPENLSPEDKIRIELTACKTIYSLLKNKKGNKYEDLLDFIDLTKNGTIYYSAAQNNLKFINSLKEESEIFPFLLQMNSGSSSNYIEINKPTFSSRISMLTLDQVKSHLIDSIPKYIIRIKALSDFNAISFTETRMSAYSEIDIFGRLEDLDPKNDDLFNKRFVISNIMKHECFSHIKFSINDSSFLLDIPIDLQLSKYEPSSPIETYSPFNGEFIQIYDPNSKIKKGESGYSFCYFITRGQKLLYNFLENTDTLADFSELYNNVELMTKQDLGEFCLKLKQLAEQNSLIKNDDEDEEQNSSSIGNYHLNIKKKKNYNYDGFSVSVKY